MLTSAILGSIDLYSRFWLDASLGVSVEDTLYVSPTAREISFFSSLIPSTDLIMVKSQVDITCGLVSDEAIMLTCPADLKVTRPVASTVATFSLLDFQLIFELVASFGVTVADSWKVLSLSGFSATLCESMIPVTAVLTTTFAEPSTTLSLLSAIMMAIPGDTPVTEATAE